MSPKQKEQLIISLIKYDLINTKLVNGLSQLGLNADAYYLHLGSTVLNLMGFAQRTKREAMFNRYMALTARANEIDISQSNKPMDVLALEVYAALLTGSVTS